VQVERRPWTRDRTIDPQRLSRKTGPQTLANVLRYMNHESDNFTAEMLLKQLGRVSGHGRLDSAPPVRARF